MSTANADPWPRSRTGEVALAACPDQLRWHPAIPSHSGLPLRRQADPCTAQLEGIATDGRETWAGQLPAFSL